MPEEILTVNGYEIIRMNYFMFFLCPLILLARGEEKIAALFGKKKTKVRPGIVPRWLNGILTKTLELESVLSGPFSFPFGLWLFVPARHDGNGED